MNGSAVCDHVEFLDGGEYVGIKCGLVLGQEYICEEKSFSCSSDNRRKLDLHSNICNILENLNLNVLCHASNVYDLINKYLSDLKCKNELKIGAAIFHNLSMCGIAYQLNRISGPVFTNISDTKKLLKLITMFFHNKIHYQMIFLS